MRIRPANRNEKTSVIDISGVAAIYPPSSLPRRILMPQEKRLRDQLTGVS